MYESNEVSTCPAMCLIQNIRFFGGRTIKIQLLQFVWVYGKPNWVYVTHTNSVSLLFWFLIPFRRNQLHNAFLIVGRAFGFGLGSIKIRLLDFDRIKRTSFS